VHLDDRRRVALPGVREVGEAALPDGAVVDVQAGGQDRGDAVGQPTDQLRLQAARVDGQPGVGDDDRLEDTGVLCRSVASISTRQAFADLYSSW